MYAPIPLKFQRVQIIHLPPEPWQPWHPPRPLPSQLGKPRQRRSWGGPPRKPTLQCCIFEVFLRIKIRLRWTTRLTQLFHETKIFHLKAQFEWLKARFGASMFSSSRIQVIGLKRFSCNATNSVWYMSQKKSHYISNKCLCKTLYTYIYIYMSIDTGLSDCIVELAIVFDLVELWCIQRPTIMSKQRSALFCCGGLSQIRSMR